MNIELARKIFLSSVDGLCVIDDTPITEEFLHALENGNLEIIVTDLVYGFRLQTSSLDGRTFVFVPGSVSQDIDGVWNLMVDTVACLRKLSGYNLYEFNNLKKDY